ncbi:MAG TPA: glycerol-3-phosphate 1-O-acyltransferase PlsY [Thermoanaerobaculia bacterium]|nr:glycerol-3-phosphate 1-O-acyltransferase PlsY [Thermoanaerobaculia bacterium]
MPYPAPEILLVVAAYGLGSLSFATILVRLFRGVDVRELGSGNAGATNVLRTSGGRLAAATMALDVGKGALAVLLMRLVTFDPRWEGLAAVAAVLGHVFPVFFGFRGGKGVATALGAFLVISPAAIAILVCVFALVVALARFVSLASITAACVLPLCLRLLKAPDAHVLTAAATTALLLFSHRANIRRLLDGSERRLGKRDER